MDTVILDNTGFNVKYWVRYSLLDFISECKVSQIFSKYDEPKRTQLLEIAYNLIQHYA